MRAYLITFDPLIINVRLVHNAILGHPNTKEWWHYISGTYIVTSDTDIVTFVRNLNTILPEGKNGILVIEVHNKAVGHLPPSAWEWLNTRVPNK